MIASSLLFCLLVTAVTASPLQDFIKGNTLFTASVYQEVSQIHKDNILVSPISAEIYLSLLQSGAKNETAEEIRHALHLPSSKKLSESAVKVVVPMLNRVKNLQLHLANKMYIKKNLAIKPNFKKIVRNVYQAQLQNIDFSEDVKAVNTINKWVEEHTEKQIRDLMNADDISNKTVSILVNALYFKGTWIHAFPKNSSVKEKFYKSSEDMEEVDTMHGSHKIFKYFDNKELDAKFLELPLNGRDLSMVIVLPNEIDGIEKLEKQVDKVFLPHNFQYKYLEVTIPKFRIENKIELKDILRNLGIKKAFESAEADFSRIAGEKGQLYVDNVIQKISMDVDESNTEVAAKLRSIHVKANDTSSEPQHFNVNHPFLYYIKMKNLILFVGRVAAPKQ